MNTVLVVSPHPDDAELGMGGTIGKMISTGSDVIIVDLTDGEPTPFGSKTSRKKETKAASKILGVKERICLDMPNRYLEVSLENRRKLAEVIRMYKPDALFGPAMPDWHPDHVAAGELIKASRFQAKFHKTDMKGEPYWVPRMYLYYSPHRSGCYNPSIIVDISSCWDLKITAIRAYESQVANSSSEQTFSLTERIEVAARYFGMCIDVEYGEPFLSDEPMSSCDLQFLGG